MHSFKHSTTLNDKRIKKKSEFKEEKTRLDLKYDKTAYSCNIRNAYDCRKLLMYR